jgi:hypothetical protein
MHVPRKFRSRHARPSFGMRSALDLHFSIWGGARMGESGANQEPEPHADLLDLLEKSRKLIEQAEDIARRLEAALGMLPGNQSGHARVNEPKVP